MNGTHETPFRLWAMPAVVWIALMLLLAATVTSAYVPLGAFNSAINLVIAAIKVVLVALFFMRLKSSNALIRLAAITGLFWLSILFVLSGADYLTRQ